MSCGTKLQPEWKFCANCRQPIAGDETPQDGVTQEAPAAEAPEAAASQAPVSRTPVPQDGVTPIVESASPAAAAPAAPATPRQDGGAPAAPGKKKNRKAIILASIAVVLVVVGVGAFLFIQNMIRGGAGSPEQVAEELVESLETKDGIGLVTMVAPAERDAVDRLQEGVLEKVEDFGIAEAASKLGEDTDEDAGEFSLDGISVTFENAVPEITEVDDQLAVLKFSTGTVRVQIDPEQTEGAIRSGLEAADEMEKIDETTELAELGAGGEPLLLAAVKDDGRWYLSPLYTGLEMANQGPGAVRGALPEPTAGSNSPAEAAEALLGAVPGILESGQFTALGNYLASHEGNAVHYYGGALDSMDGGMDASIELTTNAFQDAERDGDHGRATVETLEIDVDGDSLRLTAECLEIDGSDEVCRTGSGYVVPGASADAETIMGALPALSLSSVKEDGKWKVSLLDTTTDWALQWIDSLTREQALAMLDLARSEDTTGTITPGEDTDVTFNSAGYAVLNLELDEATALGSSDEVSSFTVYSEDGKDEVTTSDSYLAQETPAGKYKVVVFAGDDWAEKFADDGNGVQHSQPVSFQKVVEQPTIDGLPGEDYGYLTTDGNPGPTTEISLEVPEGNDVELIITAMGSYSEWDKPGTLVATLEGKEYTIPVTNDVEELVIPYPHDDKERPLKLELKKGDGSGEEVDFYLEFD